MLRTPLFALLVVPACTFSAQLPGEEAPGLDSGPAPTTSPAERCSDTSLALCVDFEDMNPLKDSSGGSLVTNNVQPMVRETGENAAEFGDTSLLRVLDSARLDIPTNLTIEMWTRPTETPPDEGDKQVGLFDVGYQYAMSFESDGQIECWIGGSDNIDSKVKIALDAWHHVACTYNGSELRVYVDGRLEGCAAYARTIDTLPRLGAAIGANVTSGAYGPISTPTYKNKFVGELDNVHVYAKTLSAGDICTLWGHANCSDVCPSTQTQRQ